MDGEVYEAPRSASLTGMGGDARIRLVRGAHRTLGGAALRFREVGWTDPPRDRVTDADLRISGEVDLLGGRAVTTTTLPTGGGCLVVSELVLERLFAVPVLGRWLERQFDEADESEEDDFTRRVVTLGTGALSGVTRLLDADAARDEGDDAEGRRIRFRVRERDGPLTRVVSGWAWLEGGGAVRRVLWTADDVRRPRWISAAPQRHRSWRLLEIDELDVAVAVTGVPDAPWRPRDA
jgi:hypothetical protein